MSCIYLFALSLRDIEQNEPKIARFIYPCDRTLEGRRRIWTSPPVVVADFSLIFFWNAKSESTYWKRLLQIIQRINCKYAFMGLKYVHNQNEIIKFIKNDSWIKATFVREPRERILSSYLGVGKDDLHMNCSCGRTVSSFLEFVEVIKQCKDRHWTPQVNLPKQFYKNMMIGKMSNISTFTELLLRRIGVWNETIKTFLGSKRMYSLTQSHAKNATQKLLNYYNTTELQNSIFHMFAEDYEVFKFSKAYF